MIVDGLPIVCQACTHQSPWADIPDYEEIGVGGFVFEYGSSNQVVVDDLGDLATVHVPQHERFGIAWIQDRRLAEIKLQVQRNSLDDPHRVTHLRYGLITVILFPVVIDDSCSHTIPTHDRWVLL